MAGIGIVILIVVIAIISMRRIARDKPEFKKWAGFVQSVGIGIILLLCIVPVIITIIVSGPVFFDFFKNNPIKILGH